MTDLTAPLLATRDALARVIHDAECGCEDGPERRDGQSGRPQIPREVRAMSDMCEAGWEYDTSFGAMCTLVAGHGGPHHVGWADGNGSVTGRIEWAAPDGDPMNGHECLARRWHDLSDHAADGTPFGGGICNCEALAPRLATIIATITEDEAVVPAIVKATIEADDWGSAAKVRSVLRAFAAALAAPSTEETGT